MATVTPMTEIAAVNICLTNLGEEPVNTLTGTIPLDASQALSVVREVTLEVQKRGWYFNTEFFSLSPDQNGHINVPANTLKVQTTDSDKLTPVVQRGTKLYNMTPFEHSFVWTRTLKVRLIMGIDFTDLPQTARSYIALRAARIFQIRQLGDQISAREDTEDERIAEAELEAEQIRMRPTSMRDSVSMASALAQRPFMINI